MVTKWAPTTRTLSPPPPPPTTTANNHQQPPTNNEVLAFTFPVDIPLDLPLSTNATTCRYYYLANVLIKTKTKQQVIKTPFSAWINPHQPSGLPRLQQEKKDVVISGRVKFDTYNGKSASKLWIASSKQ
jgi:hypothetical protein